MEYDCQTYPNLNHELYSMTSPWPFSVWGIDVIGRIAPKALIGHEYILVTIDYFTKWVEAASYSVLNAKHVARFIENDIIFRFGVPQEIILDNGSPFEGEVQRIIELYNIEHHKSSLLENLGFISHTKHTAEATKHGSISLKIDNMHYVNLRI